MCRKSELDNIIRSNLEDLNIPYKYHNQLCLYLVHQLLSIETERKICYTDIGIQCFVKIFVKHIFKYFNYYRIIIPTYNKIWKY